jgi:nucleoside-diphosphate-sugar epimerase
VDNPKAYHAVEALWGKSQTVGEIDAQFMNFDKAEKLLGWKPETNFDDGLKKTIQWFEKYLK